MSNPRQPTIGVYLEGGYVHRVSCDGDEATVVIYDDGNVQKALFTTEPDAALVGDAETAKESTRCQGIGIACDLAAERLRVLSMKQFDGTKEAIDDVVSVIEDLREMMVAALRLQAIGEEAA